MPTFGQKGFPPEIPFKIRYCSGVRTGARHIAEIARNPTDPSGPKFHSKFQRKFQLTPQEMA